MAVLFLSELSMFIKVDTSSHMAIANVHEHDAVTSRLHVTFPHIHCKGKYKYLARSANGCVYRQVNIVHLRYGSVEFNVANWVQCIRVEL